MPNRTVCSVLEEMRQLDKTRNYGAMPGLIEEVQYLVNRMEAGLWDQNDITHFREERSRLKKEVDTLETKLKYLKEQDASSVSKSEG